MATVYDYRYYIDGRYIAIVQRQSDQTYDPWLKIEDDVFSVPQVSDSSAIYIRFSIATTQSFATESTTIDISNNLAQGIIEYIRSKFAQERGDERKEIYHYNNFLRYISRERKLRGGHANIILPHGVGVIR